VANATVDIAMWMLQSFLLHELHSSPGVGSDVVCASRSHVPDRAGKARREGPKKQYGSLYPYHGLQVLLNRGFKGVF